MFAISGTFVHSNLDRSISIDENYLLTINEEGTISFYESIGTTASKSLLSGLSSKDMYHQMSSNGFLLPGFVDTHLHAPQYLKAGVALDKPLMEWLIHYTFRSESRIDADPNGLGLRVYTKLCQRLVENGTTAVSLFGTLTVEANIVLAQCCLSAGIRAHVGKVNMDLNGLPNYIETTSQSLSRTVEFIDALQLLTLPLPLHKRIVEPVITPRFIPTCSKELLEGLSELSKSRGVRVQSHLLESRDQVEWSKGMWDGKDDIEVFNTLGLLHDKTLMAHCTHTTSSHLSTLAERGTSIAHCPLSNVYFSAEKRFPLREAWDLGVNVGLGSDISGGYRVGLDDSMRWAVGVSRIRGGEELSDEVEEVEEETTKQKLATRKELAITWKDSIYLATLGGALALGLEDRIGRFEVGKSFDAQWIEIGGAGSRIDLFEEESETMAGTSIEDKIEKWWCNGSEADRKGVWVQGRCLRMLS